MQELRDENRQLLAANLAKVRQRIELACDRAGRSPSEVELVAVTKTQPAEVIPALLEAGVTAIGESRPEIMAKKQAILDCDVPWHMIGHYQRKKIKRTLPSFALVHSVHSLSLLSSLDHAAGQMKSNNLPIEILIQVNVAEENQKQGFEIKDVADVCDIAEGFSRLKLKGLMAMAPRSADSESPREVFRKLRRLRDEIGAERLPELSMGMSQDFEIAIEEGATMVRVGSVLFDGLTSDR